MNAQHPRIPRSTYRLQFNRQFTFAQAREIWLVTWMRSELATPTHRPIPGECREPARLRHNRSQPAECGHRFAGRVRRLGRRTARHGMGQILDFVPNHMGIAEPLNNGGWTFSRTARAPLTRRISISIGGRSKPISTTRCFCRFWAINTDGCWNAVSSRCSFDAGAFHLTYYEHEFPIAPGTYRYILEIALEKLAPHKRRGFLRGAAKHPHRAGIFAAAHRNRSGTRSPSARGKKRSSNADSSGGARRRRKCRRRSTAGGGPNQW